jgi:hypothetical protein
MYSYLIQTMPGCKAKFDGDTSVQYRVRRRYASTSADHKSRTDVIRTDLGYAEATAMVKRFNDTEREARVIRHETHRLALKARAASEPSECKGRHRRQPR